VLVVPAVALAIPGVAAQAPTRGGEPFVPDGLGTTPHGELTALMEVTIFNIDVLTLTVRVPPEVAERLRSLSEGRSYSEELADSVAAVVLDAEDLWARQVLHRDVGYDRIAGGMRETVEKAAEAGYISETYLADFVARIPDLFGFLRDGGASEGDEIFFRIRGDTVRTIYRTVEGEVRLDRAVVDPEARRASVPAFFAPDTRFRKRLVESLLAAGEVPHGGAIEPQRRPRSELEPHAARAGVHDACRPLARLLLPMAMDVPADDESRTRAPDGFEHGPASQVLAADVVDVAVGRRVRDEHTALRAAREQSGALLLG
jgi:hypothetical protein